MEKHEMELTKENGAWVVRYCIDGAERKFRTYDAARRYFIAVGNDQITKELYTPKRGTVVPVPPELKTVVPSPAAPPPNFYADAKAEFERDYSN